MHVLPYVPWGCAGIVLFKTAYMIALPQFNHQMVYAQPVGDAMYHVCAGAGKRSSAVLLLPNVGEALNGVSITA